MIKNSEKIVVAGAKGMLGEYVCENLLNKGHDVIAVDINEFDLTDEFAVSDFFLKTKVSWIVNCAAYTDVESAEDIQNREVLYKVNRDAVFHLANAAVALNAKLIHFSTDYVYKDGCKKDGHFEADSLFPLNEYGKSKLEGENILLSVMDSGYYVLRISWLYGGAKKNFVRTIVKASLEREILTVVDDQRGNPTYTKDVAEVVGLIIEKKPEAGIYNFSGSGECSWREFADETLNIYAVKGRDKIKTKQVTPILSSQFPTKAKRPLCSSMSKSKIEERLKIKVPDWKCSLRSYILEDAKFDF